MVPKIGVLNILSNHSFLNLDSSSYKLVLEEPTYFISFFSHFFKFQYFLSYSENIFMWQVSDEFHAEVADFAVSTAMATSNKTLSVQLMEAVLDRKQNAVIR